MTFVSGLLSVLAITSFIAMLLGLVRPSLLKDRKTGEVPPRKDIAAISVVAALFAIGSWATRPEEQKAATKQPPGKPMFSFRDMIAMETTLDEARRGETLTGCTKDYNSGDVRCGFNKTRIAGVDVSDAKADFVDGTFDYLDAQFASYNYETLRDEMIKIYGKPCSSEADQEERKKKQGRMIRGREVQWCFGNGFLSLMEKSRHGWGSGELEFISNREHVGETSYNASTL